MVGIYYGGFLEKHCNLIAKYSLQALIKMLGPDNVVVIDRFKGNSLAKLVSETNVRIVKYNPPENSRYDECLDLACRILKDEGITKVILFRNYLISEYRVQNPRVANYLEKRLREGNPNAFKYGQFNSIAQSYMFVKAAAKLCDIVVQFGHDIDEYRFDTLIKFKKYYQAYLANIDGVVFMPTFEIGLQLYADKSKCNKQFDFVFYCTAKIESRKYILEQRDRLQAIKNSDVVVVGPKESHSIKEDQYDDLLRKAKFTMVIPAYNEKHFSIWRIIEAVMNDCLCLCYSKNNMRDLRCTFPDICDIMETDLMFDSFDDIESKIAELEPRRDKLIQTIRNTDSFRKITDFDWCQKRWKRMLREE